MFETINEVAVLVVSFLALAMGSIWYSPFLFGTIWQRVAGLKEGDLTYSRSEFFYLLVSVLLANVVIFGVISHTLTVVPRSILSLGSLWIGLVLFIAAILTSMVMWERRSFMYGCIHIGYAVLVIGVGVGVIHYWPW